MPSMGRVKAAPLITGTFLTQKAHSLREKGAFGHRSGHSSILGSLSRAAVLEGLAWLPRVELPQSSGNQWEPAGFQPGTICTASHINQAFPAVSHISGNFLTERIGRQPHSSASYSCPLCITAVAFKKIRSWAMWLDRAT